jgi:hypothetical protein
MENGEWRIKKAEGRRQKAESRMENGELANVSDAS